MTKDDTKGTELQNVTPTGRPAPRRLASASAAYAIYNKLKDLDEQDARRRAILQGMINGNPPYNPTELKDKGLGHMCNVNFMTMRANLDERAAAAHELFMEVATLVELRPRQAAEANPDVYHWCSIIAEEFSDMVNDWDGFLPAMDLAVRESDAYGIGYVLFPDEYDWRFKASRRSALLFDPQARVDLDDNDFIQIRDEISVGALFDEVIDEEMAAKRGWQVKEVRELLVRTFEEGESKEEEYQASTWESLEHRYRNNDYEFQAKQFDRVRVIHTLVRENAVAGDEDTRKVSHYIMAESQTCQEFIFKAEDRYDRLGNVMWWLPYNYGDGFARSVRGIASQMAQHDDLSNRFLSEVFNLGMLSTKLLMQPATPGDLGRLQFFQHGNFAVMPPNLNVIQTSFRPQIAPLLQLRDVSERVMMNNTGSYRKHSEGIDREAMKTASQVQMEASKEARYEKAAIAHRYNQLDRLYREMFRRALSKAVQEGEAPYPGKKMAKDMMKRCLDRGVDRKFILNWEKNVHVAATRSIGMGSLGVKYDLTNQIINMANKFDEAGQREALYTWVSARVGPRNAGRYVQKIDRDQITSNESSISALEWNDIVEGQQVIVGSDQVHKLHIDVFLPRMGQIVQMFQQQQTQDPAADSRTLQLAIQHIMGHLQFLGMDPQRKEYVDQIVQFLQQVDQVAKQLQQVAEKIAQAQQKQAEANQQLLQNADQVMKDRELEAKMFEIQRKYEMEQLKQESLNNMRAQKTAVQMDISRQKAAGTTQLQAQRQAVELQLMREKAAAETELIRSKAQG